MKNLITRAISGTVYVALIVGAIIAGPQWFVALCALFATIGMFEYYRIAEATKNARLLTTFDIFSGLIFFLTTASWLSDDTTTIYFVLGYSLCLIIRVIWQVLRMDFNPIQHLASSLFGHIYVALPLALLTDIHRTAPGLVLLIFILIWLNDTGAYLIGSSLGRHKMFPRVSPKKSWEGFAGGLVFTIAAAILYALNYPRISIFNDWRDYTILALVVSIAATFGDLLESTFKRAAGVKDSGNLIPGHGGILDRIDSLLLVAPCVIITTIAMSLL